MAEIDIDRNPVPGQPFIEVYPVSTRLLTSGLWFSLSVGSDKTWPVENDPDVGDTFGQRQVWHYYASEHPDIGSLAENVGPGYWYDHDWDTIQMFSQAPNEFQDRYLYAPTWIHYDLAGINASAIQRADFVCNIGGNSSQNDDNLDFIVQMRNDITAYNGWQPSPLDFRTITGGLVCPVLSTETIINNSIGTSHAFSDPFPPPDYDGYGPRHVLPINQAGIAQLKRGGRQGIFAGLDGSSPPSGDNFLFMECQYTTWDDELAAGKRIAGALLPILRLWLGGSEAEMMLSLGIDARPRIEQNRRILTHKARQIRGY